MKKVCTVMVALVLVIAGLNLSAFAATRHSDEARAVLGYVNDARAAEGLSPLTWESSLESFAYTRANEIVTLWSHTRPNGQSATDYPGVNGENLAYGTDYTAAEVVEGWLNSPSHRANILTAEFTSMAVACIEEITTVEGYGEVSIYYWVQLFHIEKKTSENNNNTSENNQNSNISSSSRTSNTDRNISTTTRDYTSQSSRASSAANSSSSSTATTATKATVSGKVDSSIVVNAVKKNGSATVKNKDSVSASVLKAMAKENSGAKLIARTYFSDDAKKIQGQITITASSFSKLENDFKLGVYSESSKVKTVTKNMNKWYKNNLVVVKIDQTGTFPAAVSVAVKADLSKLDTKNLVFYSYDTKSNTISKIESPNYSIDKNDFLHFTTSMGGYIVITDKALSK